MQSFFHTLLRPDKEENPERALVARAANILQVGEFQLLQLAYQEWFGFDLPRAQVDRLFTAYMLHNHVPHWAREYARKIIDMDERGVGGLDRDPFYHRYDAEYVRHVPEGAKRFTIACLIVGVLLFGSIWFSHFAATNATSVLPPYFDRDELSGARPPGPAAD